MHLNSLYFMVKAIMYSDVCKRYNLTLNLANRWSSLWTSCKHLSFLQSARVCKVILKSKESIQLTYREAIKNLSQWRQQDEGNKGICSTTPYIFMYIVKWSITELEVVAQGEKVKGISQNYSGLDQTLIFKNSNKVKEERLKSAIWQIIDCKTRCNLRLHLGTGNDASQVLCTVSTSW